MREALRITSTGEKAVNALGGAWNGSKKERRVIRQVGELREEAADAISRIQKLCDLETREWIAKNLYELVLKVPRGDEGYRVLFALDQQLRQATDLRHYAPWLARLLVQADHLCESAGGDGLAAGLLVAEMQGWMERFMAENGFRGWGTQISEGSRFDVLRSSRPMGRRILFTPVGEAGSRGEALRVAARSLGLATAKWAETSLLVAAACVSSAMMTRALTATRRDVTALSPQERAAAAMGLWATADATCHHTRIADWELVPLLAHTQLFLDVNAAKADPEAAGAALGIEGRILGDAFSALQKSAGGINVIAPLGQAANDFCRTGDERYLFGLGSAAMSLAPFVRVSRESVRVVLE